VSIVILLIGSFVQTSTLLLSRPGRPVVSTVTVIFPVCPGWISAELVEVVVHVLQAGTISMILSVPFPEFTNSKSWVNTAPSFTFPASNLVSVCFMLGAPDFSSAAGMPDTSPFSWAYECIAENNQNNVKIKMPLLKFDFHICRFP
jgi:hypothetical protein